jgi:ATP-dependent RNA helicase MSS116
LKSIANTYRLYSDEAAAVQEEISHPAPARDLVNFKDLTQVGVHGSLIDAIVKDMGYESMTPVQSKTINPALKGTDM